ncbi:BTB/POZ domain-containing protein 17-like [Theropithecus gelada]|uniref:BTB/POZ domain-containing protein 17-like n=1 Tax=Theropithecus gelada TaxID=9565 RepID=UPI000DC16966|nr:BTB/POZ domain-containing protein 17-like [Theropithecus gelada]
MPTRGYSKPGSWGSFWAMLTLVGLVTRAAQRADVGGEAAGTSINHSQAVLQRLQELLRQGNASDVVLRVQAVGTDEVRVFHAHRLLLGLHSELFRELLSNQSEAVLQEPQDCAAVFDKFISSLSLPVSSAQFDVTFGSW